MQIWMICREEIEFKDLKDDQVSYHWLTWYFSKEQNNKLF